MRSKNAQARSNKAKETDFYNTFPILNSNLKHRFDKEKIRTENSCSRNYQGQRSSMFQGKNLKYAPDIIVGFHRGYRASWQTALGAVPKDTVEDNTQAWTGDHCMSLADITGQLPSSSGTSFPSHPNLVEPLAPE